MYSLCIMTVSKKNKRRKRFSDFFMEHNEQNDDDNNNNSNNELSITSNNSSFNDNPYVRESHNCYMYFLNKKNHEVVKLCKKDYPKYNMCRRAQPGYASGFDILRKRDYNCPVIMERTLKDNPGISKTSFKKKCKPTHYKGALVVAPHRDYHYYRYNDDGLWTHKPGYKPSTHLDSNNNLIRNPRKAARDYGGTLNYKDFCGYLCVPREKTHKRMAHLNSRTQQGGTKKRKGTRRSEGRKATNSKATNSKATNTTKKIIFLNPKDKVNNKSRTKLKVKMCK